MATTNVRPAGRGMSVGMVAEWRIARNLFPIYMELARQSGQCPPPFSSFGSDDRPESLEAVRNWFDALDATCPAARFRTEIESVVGLNDTAWHTIALHFLVARRSDRETRKKLAFGLTRYFAISCPPSFRSKSITARQVADVLQPLIGDCPDSVDTESALAHDVVKRLENCRGLAELVSISRDLDGWEESLGDGYLMPVALAQAAHLHYLLHLVAVDMVQALRLQIVPQLKALREHGLESLDCRAAGMSEIEAVDGLIATWNQWQVSNDIEYRLEELARVLLGLEKALANTHSNVADARVDAELAALRALAERFGAQLSAVTQRLQRLESIIDLQGPWTPSAETIAATNKFRVTPPPAITSSATVTPIAARTSSRATSDAQPFTIHPLLPRNGNLRS